MPLHPGEAHRDVLRPVRHDLEVRVVVHHLSRTPHQEQHTVRRGALPFRRLDGTSKPTKIPLPGTLGAGRVPFSHDSPLMKSQMLQPGCRTTPKFTMYRPFADPKPGASHRIFVSRVHFGNLAVLLYLSWCWLESRLEDIISKSVKHGRSRLRERQDRTNFSD